MLKLSSIRSWIERHCWQYYGLASISHTVSMNKKYMGRICAVCQKSNIVFPCSSGKFMRRLGSAWDVLEPFFPGPSEDWMGTPGTLQ